MVDCEIDEGEDGFEGVEGSKEKGDCMFGVDTGSDGDKLVSFSYMSSRCSWGIEVQS